MISPSISRLGKSGEFPSAHAIHPRDHHRKVKRIALAADTKLASLAPSIAEHFIQSEVKSFGYDELDAAIAWAGRRCYTELLKRLKSQNNKWRV